MGNRAYLKIYLSEDELVKEEADYYRAYIESRADDYDLMKLKAKKVKFIWNDNFNYMPDQVPTCEYIRSNGKLYFAPDTSFSKEEDLVFESKNYVPEAWSNLFIDEQFINRKEYRGGKEYPCWTFQASVQGVLERLRLNPSLQSNLQEYVMDTIKLVPENSILELTFNEIRFDDLEDRVKEIIVKNKGILATYVNDDHVTFNIHVVFEGDSYGLNDCLVNNEKDPLIEFYDANYDFDKYGQFVTRYNLSSLMESRGRLKQNGLCLDGGVANWKLTPSNMRGLYQYLEVLASCL